MLASMTGFARHHLQAEWGQATFEIRSVNHRYLEIGLKLPDWCRELEEVLRGRIKKHLNRGKIDVYLYVQGNEQLDPPLLINHPLMSKLNDVIQETSHALVVDTEVNVMDVLRWPDMIRVGERALDGVKPDLLSGLDKALQALVQARQTEGQVLADILTQKGASLLAATEGIIQQQPTRQAQVKQKLQGQLDELVERLQPERLEQEVIFYLNRLDVAEELDRLRAHCHNFLKLIQEGGPMGRRLDFLVQEMNRETNTLAAKSGSIEVSEQAIEMKVLIEQMREQIQNLE